MYNELLIVIPTFHKRVKYIPQVDHALNINFNISAPRAYISDISIDSLNAEVFVSNNEQWAEIILDGLIGLEKQFKYEYVFLMLEDLFPFFEVPASVIQNHLSIMKEGNYKCIVFSTYPREWMEASFSRCTINDVSFYKVHQSFRFYSQLQPGIWNKEYLKSILKELIAQRNYSPWEFEYFKSQEVHLMSDYCWPNVLGGFIESGKVNMEAIKKMKGNKDLRLLTRMLMKEYYLEIPGNILKRIMPKKALK